MLTTAEMYLALLAFVLFAALVIVCALWRIDSRDADSLAEQLAKADAKNRHLQQRNEQLRDELDTRTPRPGDDRRMTVEVMAWLGELPITHPGDNR